MERHSPSGPRPVPALLCALLLATLPGCLDQLLGLGEDDDAPPAPGPDATVDDSDLCEPCLLAEQCGGEADRCLANRETHERFCGADCTAALCPTGYQCLLVGSEGGREVRQCVPEGLGCDLPPEPCEPACSAGAGEACVRGHCLAAGGYLEERALCLDLVNAYRARAGVAALGTDRDLQACAAEAAEMDGETEQPHGYFEYTGGCGAVAQSEVEIPGWPLTTFGTVDAVVDLGIGTFFAGAPTGAEYLTLVAGYTRLGCGVYVTTDGAVWLVLQLR